MVILFIGVLGLCLGSFVNALVWRVREQELLTEAKPKDVGKKLRDLSIVNGRSICPNCKHKLGYMDLVPVASWVFLGGKCRYCKKPVSRQYPLVELLVAALTVVSYVAWPYAGVEWSSIEAITFGVWLLIVTGLTALAVYDIKWFLLPDRIVFPLTALGLFFVALRTASEQDWLVLGWSIIGAGLIAGIFYALFQFSEGRWIGGGDVKLGVLLGLLAGGIMQAFLLLFLASSLGTLYAGALIVAGKQKLSRSTRIPFGPFLIAAVIIIVLVGDKLINWYSNLILGI